jgi:hypothetical protein
VLPQDLERSWRTYIFSLIYVNLFLEVTDALDTLAQTLTDIQNQIDYLVAVVLQNRRAFNMITAGQTENFNMVGEHCCFWVNKLGQV